jgi:hypothetical protein
MPEFVTSHGTTFSFNGNTYKCVDISREGSAPSRERVDMSTLDLEDGDEMVMVLAPLKPKRDPKKFTITYRTQDDTAEIEEGEEGTLSTTGGSGEYRVTSVGESRKTNAYVEGTATFEEKIEDEEIAGS